jgi:hypothetical protein
MNLTTRPVRPGGRPPAQAAAGPAPAALLLGQAPFALVVLGVLALAWLA